MVIMWACSSHFHFLAVVHTKNKLSGLKKVIRRYGFPGSCNNFPQLPKKRNSKILLYFVVVVRCGVSTCTKNLCNFSAGFS